jgi:hypothetical protein
MTSFIRALNRCCSDGKSGQLEAAREKLPELPVGENEGERHLGRVSSGGERERETPRENSAKDSNDSEEA